MGGDNRTRSQGFLAVATIAAALVATRDANAQSSQPESTTGLAPASRLSEAASLSDTPVGDATRPTCCEHRARSCCLSARPTLMEKLRSWKHRHQDAWVGNPDEFREQPLGTSVNDTIERQKSNGEAALMVLHHQDFSQGRNPEKLNLRGREELRRIAKLLPRSFAPVIIEQSANSELDEKRRRFVLSTLNSGSFPVPEERVIVDSDPANGLGGVEAVVVDLNLIDQTRLRGQLGSATGTTGASGTTASGSVSP